MATRREGAGGSTAVGGRGSGEKGEGDERDDDDDLAVLKLALACGGGTAARPRAWTESQKASTKEDQRCF